MKHNTMEYLIGVAILVLALVAAGGCATSSGAAAVKKTDAKAVEESVTVPTPQLPGQNEAAAAKPELSSALSGEPFPEYRIGPGDALNFRFFDDETLSTEVTVRYDGCVSLPLIPDQNLSGKTRDEAMGMLKQAYSSLFHDPQMTLSVSETASKTFSVMGEVSSPGEYPYARPLSLIDGITLAGGIRVQQSQQTGYSPVGAQGQLVKALIIRHKGTEREVFDRDLRGFQKAGPHAADTLILPGDIIYLPESVNLVYILGEVRSPGVFAISEGLTLLQLLTRAGGFDESAGRLQHVVLLRQENEQSTKVMLINVKHILKTGQDDILLAPGDIIYIPRKPLVNLQAFVGRIVGTISPVFSLYRQAYDTYYTNETFKRMFEKQSTTTANDLLTVQQIRNASSLIGSGITSLNSIVTAK